MTKQQIINQVKNIILKYSKPRRIYLYGSLLTEESEKAGDIDIAFDDENYKNISEIPNEVNNLETLLKIDIKNIAFCEDRFKNRVIATGKVIYSSTKKLRFEDSFHNFKKALNKFESIIKRKDEFDKEGFSDVYLDIVVKRFEFTYEMAWKCLKRRLDYLGIECKNPRNCFEEAYAQGIIEEEDVWLNMIELRNLSSHIYDENEVAEIMDYLDKFSNAFKTLEKRLGSGI